MSGAEIQEAESIMSALRWLRAHGTGFERLIACARRHVERKPLDVRKDWWDKVWSRNVRRGCRDTAAVALEAALLETSR